MSGRREIEAAPLIGHVNVPCQCKRWPLTDGCRRPMTQEDLICDECRNGKCGQLEWFGSGQPPRHVVFTGFKWKAEAGVGRALNQIADESAG